MAGTRPASKPTTLDRGTFTYEQVRVVITPEGPFHYEVTVRHADGDQRVHAVEHVEINGTQVFIDAAIWFIDADLDVGVPIGHGGETAWVWP